MSEEHTTERLTYLVEEWAGEDLSPDDREILVGSLPVLGEAYGDAAPVTFPDGSPTEAKMVISQLTVTAVRALAARNDDQTAWRVLLLMRYARQPHNVPTSVSWVELVSETRDALEASGDASDLAALDASENLNLTWWKQDGQWQEFEQSLVEARTAEEVAAVAVVPSGDQPVRSEDASSTPTKILASGTGSAQEEASSAKGEIADESKKAMRMARISMFIACAALVIGPLAGFAAARVLEEPGPQGVRGPQGPRGVAGEQGPAGEGADYALEEIENLRQCVNEYMRVVARSAGGPYQFFYC